jgi:hypothetical protein
VALGLVVGNTDARHVGVGARNSRIRIASATGGTVLRRDTVATAVAVLADEFAMASAAASVGALWAVWDALVV